MKIVHGAGYVVAGFAGLGIGYSIYTIVNTLINDNMEKYDFYNCVHKNKNEAYLKCKCIPFYIKLLRKVASNRLSPHMARVSISDNLFIVSFFVNSFIAILLYKNNQKFSILETTIISGAFAYLITISTICRFSDLKNIYSFVFFSFYGGINGCAIALTCKCVKHIASNIGI